MFYVGIEGEGGIDIMNKLSKKGLESPVRLEGDTPELGDFEIQIVDGRLILYKNIFFSYPHWIHRSAKLISRPRHWPRSLSHTMVR
jgi:hypothetical protein